uniref:Uncharacterized protein n=1 Tax=Arundo donax TaxID=35708 RepID=A0A0A9SBF3_ARUDO
MGKNNFLWPYLNNFALHNSCFDLLIILCLFDIVLVSAFL